MDWLKDPKNQKFVVPILIAIIVGVGVFYYFKVIKPPTPPAPEQTAAQVDPATGQPVPAGGAAPAPATDPAAGTAPAPAPAGGEPATGVATAAAPAAAAPGAAQVASVTPMQTWRSDPFQPIGYKAPPKGRAVIKPPILDFPFTKLPGISIPRVVEREEPEVQQPSRRMAGILLNDRVYAIIETGGTSQVVQPGDYLLDRLASVERIEPGKVILKTVDAKPRYITVRMAASQHTDVTAPVSGANVAGPPAPGAGATTPIRRPTTAGGAHPLAPE